MNNVLQDLLRLQALEFGEANEKNIEAEVAQLRARLPEPIIGHYDRLRVRGKKGVAMVRNQVCSGCHMHVPIGQITVLMRGEDIQLCECCGRYLSLPDAAEAEPAVASPVEAAEPPVKVKAKAKAKAKTPAKPRKRQAVAAVA